MATVTSPIILDSTGQDIKTSIDLLTANINRTASNIAYDNNLTIKGKIDALQTQVDNIEYGQTESVQIPANSYADFPVSFTKTHTANAMVIHSLKTVTGNPNNALVWGNVTSFVLPTTTYISAKIRAFNNSSTAVSVYASYIVIG